MTSAPRAARWRDERRGGLDAFDSRVLRPAAPQVTTKTAPAGPLRHERHFNRRATGGALRGERSDELQAREDEEMLAMRL